MSTQHHNDDHLFERLVDGELSTEQRQQLLASLDEREHGWRKCALAFLEAQALRQQMSQLIAEPASVSSATEPTITKQPERELPPTSKSGQWLAIAAGLLIAFAGGWLAKSPFAEVVEQPQLANVPQMANVDEQPIAIEKELLSPDDAVTLVVRDLSGQHQRLQVPLMEIDSPDAQFASALPADLQDRFRSQGYDLQRRRRFAPMFFEQGQQLVPMVVPVEDTYVVPVDRPIY